MRISVAAAVLPPLLLAAASAVVLETCTYTDASCTNKVAGSCLRGPDQFDDPQYYEMYQSGEIDGDEGPNLVLADYTSCNSLPRLGDDDDFDPRRGECYREDDAYKASACIDTPGDSSGMSTLAIVGIVVGCCGGAVVLYGLYVLYKRYKNEKREEKKNRIPNANGTKMLL